MEKATVLVLYGGGYHDFDVCGKVLVDYLNTTGNIKPASDLPKKSSGGM